MALGLHQLTWILTLFLLVLLMHSGNRPCCVVGIRKNIGGAELGSTWFFHESGGKYINLLHCGNGSEKVL